MIHFTYRHILTLLLLLLISSNAWSSISLIKIDQPPQVFDSIRKVIDGDELSYIEKSELLDSIGRYYHKKENYKEAIRYVLQSIILHKKNGNGAQIAHYNERIGVMFYYLGNYDSAVEHFLSALDYTREQNMSLKEAQILGNVANVYTRLDKYDQAVEYLLGSKKIYEDLAFNDSTLLAGIYINLGLAYEKAENLDSAAYYYNNSLELIKEKDLFLYEATIYNNKGEIFFKRNNYTKALNYYHKAYSLFQKITNENGMGTALLNIARIHLQRENYKATIENCEEALIHFEKVGSLFNIVEIERILSEAFRGLNNYQNAIDHLERYILFNDSLKGSKIQEYIANLEMQNMAQREQQKYELYKQKSELRENRLQIEKLYLYITIGGVVVVLILVLLLLLNMRKNLQHNKLKRLLLEEEQTRMRNDITFKQREIENFANHIQEKNKLLKDLSSEIKRITKSSKNELGGLKNLKDIVNQSIYVDENRKELELKIDHAHQQFIQRLKTKFPELSKTEIRLCSLLLLKFSSKEIAAIMNIEPASVKMGRNRLRKRLHLEPRSDISQFLSTI